MILLRTGKTELQPYSKSVAQFAYRFGLVKYFIRCIETWGSAPFAVQIEAFKDFLYRVRLMDVNNMHPHNLLLRNRVRRETYDRIRWLYFKKHRKVAEKDFHAYLESSGLGQYFKYMQDLGKRIQI